jgi:hypothetical protein
MSDIETKRTRIRYQEPWYSGLPVGSGSVEGACKPVVQARFKRAGMRWTTRGFLHVLELRLARLNGTLQTVWVVFQLCCYLKTVLVGDKL